MAVKPIPEGYHTVTAYLLIPDVAAELEFVKQAFSAKVVDAFDMGGKIMHADVLIGDSHVMMGMSSDRWPSRPGMLYLYTEVCWLRRRIGRARGNAVRDSGETLCEAEFTFGWGLPDVA